MAARFCLARPVAHSGRARLRSWHLRALPHRRPGTIPMRELLDLRMQGIKIEEATTWLEKISGKIELENLYPSWLVFGEGFRRNSIVRAVRRAISVIISLIGLVFALP